MRLHRDALNRTLTILFAVTILFLVPASAQVTTGDITGRITDSEQRVVAGATVTATNKGTGQSRTATTNEAGGTSRLENTTLRWKHRASARAWSEITN